MSSSSSSSRKRVCPDDDFLCVGREQPYKYPPRQVYIASTKVNGVVHKQTSAVASDGHAHTSTTTTPLVFPTQPQTHVHPGKRPFRSIGPSSGNTHTDSRLAVAHQFEVFKGITRKVSNSTVHADGCTLIGDNNLIIGDNNMIVGSNIEVRGTSNTVVGNNNPSPPPGNFLCEDQSEPSVPSNRQSFFSMIEPLSSGDTTFTPSWLSSDFRVSTTTPTTTPKPPEKIQPPGLDDGYADKQTKCDEIQCVICCDNMKRVCLEPCGHFYACIECTKREIAVNKDKSENVICANCRVPIEKYKIIFLD